MKTLDRTLPEPAANLACDEALLDAGEEVLRFWEASDYFVVVGYSNQAATEVNVAACEQRRVPVLRRCSGGGTVVQGPGCLNYALVMPAPSESVTDTNRFIMERHRAAIAQAIGGTNSCESVAGQAPARPNPTTADSRSSSLQFRHGVVTFDGHTDLALDGRKFSGNSQRRRKKYILFHGTFLLNFDLTLVEQLLRFPSKQPAYRQSRAHADFLTNLRLPAATVKEALRQTWDATEPLTSPPYAVIERLVREKYSTAEWTEKF